MQKVKVSIPILFLFCLFFHPVMFKESEIISYAYIYGIPVIYLMLNINGLRILTLKQIIIIGLASSLAVLSVLYPTLHGTYDYSYVRVATYMFRKIVIYIFLIYILTKHYQKEMTVSHFMYYFSLSQAAYVMGTIIIVFFPGFRNVWFNIFSEVIDSESHLQSFGYTFRIGWQGFSGYGPTIFCSISCIFLMYLYYGRNREVRLSAFQFFVPFILSFLGNMFYGRSGLVVSIAACLIALIIWNRNHFYKLFRFGVLVVLIMALIYSLRNVRVFRDWYYWMSTPLVNLIRTGSFNNASISATHDMIFQPPINTLLFGDGFYMQNGHYYMRTDSGIMRNILFWGLLGTVGAYGMTVYSLAEAKKRDIFLFLLLLGAFTAFEYKGHVYNDFASLIFAFTFVDSIKNCCKKT